MFSRVSLGASCLAVLAILTIATAPAAGADFRSIPLAGGEPRVEIVSESLESVRLTVEVGELVAMDVETPEGTFTRLLIPGFHSSHDAGRPELPMMNRLVGVPAGATARVRVVATETRLVDLADHGPVHRLFPAQPSLSKSADAADVPFEFDAAAYDAGLVAREPARVVGTGRLRALDLARLEVSPVEYLPRENRLRVAERMEIEIRFEGADLAAQRERFERTGSLFFDHLYSRVANARAFHDAYPDRVGDVVTMVVVTPPAYESTLAEFIAWKRERGFHVIVGVLGDPEVGFTSGSVQSWIRDLYLNPDPGVPAPSFVVFVGDIAEMPTFTENGDVSDRPYCAIDGDLVPDMYYGRLSCTNPTQLANILEKTLMYDRLEMPDPSYLEEVVMIAGMDSSFGPIWANGQINYGTTNYFNAAHGILSHTYLYPASGSSDAQIVQNVSDGVGYINYTAHGSTTSWSDPTFTQANIASLQNDGEYCLAVGNCCLTSSYEVGECFAETWLRAEDKGAIGYIGGSNSTYWDEDYWWGVGHTASIVANPTYEGTQLGMYDGLFHDHGEAEHLWYVTNDALIFCGNLAVMESGSSRTAYYWTIYNLMGDPSLSAWLGVPTPNPVSHPSTVFTTSPSLDVSAEIGSYVGLTQDGVLVGAGTVGASGTLAVEFLQSPLVPGVPLHMVVTAQNRAPYVADLPVAVPATVLVDPAAIDANVPTAVTVTVLEADGVTPKPGIDVWAEGLDYATTPVATDASGVAVLSVTYPYGPSLDIVGQEPGAGYRLFTHVLPVNAATLPFADITVATTIGLADTMALNLPAMVEGTTSEPGAVLWVTLPDGTTASSTILRVPATPTTLGDATAILAVSGFDLHVETFPVIEAYGTLTGTVASGGSPLAGVVVRGFDAAMDPAFEVVTNASGAWDVGAELLVADYTVSVDHFGYLPVDLPYFVNYGANVLDIALDPAPAGTLAGTVTETGTGIPLAATVKVYRTDTMELYAQTESDSLDGTYVTPSLPYFDYEVVVRAWRHVPETVTVTIDGPTRTLDFVLDQTAGDLLLVDDGAKGTTRPAKLSDKDGTEIAAAYGAAPSKSAGELAADLEALGYFVTTEAVGSTNPATWGDYDLVIVACGDNTGTLADASIRSALVAHVQAGGHVLLEGGEVGYDHASGDPAFAANVMHSNDWNADSAGNLTVAEPTHRVMSVPNVLPSTVPLTYSGYGDSDAMAPLPDAVAVGAWTTYASDASVIAYDSNPAPEGGQIVFFAFNYPALDGGVRRDLLENAILWLVTPEAGTCTVSGVAHLEGETDHAGILVQALPGGASTVTGPDGSYLLPGLFHGTCDIVASRDGWSTESQTLVLEEDDEVIGVDFTLSPVYAVMACETPGLAIPDANSTGLRDTCKVATSGEINSVEVWVDITHTYIGDLIVTLTSPQGTTVTLHSRSGGSADNLVGWYPTELTPAQSLDAFLGQEISGNWVMHVSDNAGADLGILNEWCVHLGYPGGATSVGPAVAPRTLQLAQNFPNPFADRTTFAFGLPRDMDVSLDVYDVSGRRVATLARGVLPAGFHRTEWDGRDRAGARVASGIYLVRLRTEEGVLARKLLFLR